MSELLIRILSRVGQIVINTRVLANSVLTIRVIEILVIKWVYVVGPIVNFVLG